MKCDFCGCDLPLILASSDIDALFGAFDKTESKTDSYICIDLNNKCVYEFWCTKIVEPMDGYRHLCKKCATGLDAFGSALLERDCQLREMYYKNCAANVLNKVRGKEVHQYMVAIDVGVKDRPVAQVFKKDGDRWVVTNTIVDYAVGHLITYMEGTADD